MNRRVLAACGMIAPVWFIALTILGGAIRPGYSHISETISELFSPGSPNKALLDPLYTIYALLLVLFGIGILQYVRGFEGARWTGIIAASLYIAMGLLNVATATLFPQDAWGTPPTFPGKMHEVLHGFIGLLSILSMLLLGVWFHRTEILPRFWIYSSITVVLAVISAGFLVANLGGPMMGLTERISGLVGFQWTFVLALWIYSRKEYAGSSKNTRFLERS